MSFYKLFCLSKHILKSKVTSLISKRSLVINVDQLFDNKVYKLHLLDAGPSPTVEITKEKALLYYQQMDEIRKVENACAQAYREKIIKGFCHLYVGEEAIAVGINSVMRPQDTIITSYRCHGWAVLRCESVASVLAELYGFSNGTARGKGGSMHIYGPQFFGGNGIVGAHVPMGCGIAYKHKYTNSDAISVTCYGDGAANQGQVFEAFNLAKLKMLPVLFVVENNGYGLGTSCSRSSANNEYYRASVFIPGIRASGMDILSVIETTKYCFKHILDGKGPIILELMTYRYFGHSMSDPGTSYRPREEIQEVREKKDCIQHLHKLIVDSNLGTEEEIKQIEKENKKKVEKYIEEAKKGKPPSVEELTSDCYKDWPGTLRVPKMLSWAPHKHFGTFPPISK